MATIASHMPVADHFSHCRRRSENRITTPSLFPWDQSLYSDLALFGPQSYDSIYTSPDLPNSPPYSESQESDLDETLLQSFLLGDFDNLLGGWDDPTGTALSLLVKPSSATRKSGPLTPEMDISPSASINLATLSNEVDDSVAFEDSMNDEPLFQSPQALQETTDIPPHDCLYSTPPAWEQPKLSPDESRLHSIAMPAQLCATSPPSSPSPKSQDSRSSRKRKSSESSVSDFSPPTRSRPLAPQKTAHNKIEKRYRTNLNDKIAALRDSVPSLRVVDKNNPCGEGLQEDLQGLSPAHKLNKATILSKAAEYIRHLEKQNKCLTEENQSLKGRLEAFEIVVMAQSGPGAAAHAAANGRQAS